MKPKKRKSYKRALLLALALVAGLVSRGTADSLPMPPGISGSLSSTGMSLVFIPAYTGMVALQVTGAWTGSIVAQCAVDASSSGGTFEVVNCYRATTGAGSQAITGNGIYRVDTNGCGQVKFLAGSIASGTAILIARAAPGALPPPAQMPANPLTNTPSPTASPTPSNTPVVSATPTATPVPTP